MTRFLVVTTLGFAIGLAFAVDARFKRQEKQARSIAVEEACRTIVEAGLVASCSTIK